MSRAASARPEGQRPGTGGLVGDLDCAVWKCLLVLSLSSLWDVEEGRSLYREKGERKGRTNCPIIGITKELSEVAESGG